MSHHSTAQTSDSHHSSTQDQENHFKLRIELFAFERTTMEVHLANCIEKIQRQHSSFLPEEFKVLPHHDLLEFMLLGENSLAPAFDFYTISVQLIQQVNPSRLFFTATLMGESTHFPSASYIDTLYHPTGIRSTIFKLNSQDGFLSTPPVLGLTVENEIVVSQFSLSILLENLSFAASPFQDYTPVEIKKGCLFFPLNPNYQGQCPVQQTHFYSHYMPMFNHPPPTLDPPRLLRNDLNVSVPWNSQQQTYMSRERSEHINNVRQRLNNSRRNEVDARASATQQPRIHQPSSQNQPHHVPQTSASTRPVMGNLYNAQQGQPQSGLSQTLVPPGLPLHPVEQPVPPVAPVHAGGASLLPVQTGSVTFAPAHTHGATGGTEIVPHARSNDDSFQTALDNLNINEQPSFSVNLPPLFPNQTGGRRGINFTDPRYVLNYPMDQDMAWDDYHIQLTSDVDFLVPSNSGPTPTVVQPNARANGQFAPPPLAQSNPKYPSLPTTNHSPYGPHPNQISGVAGHSTSPPIRHGTIGTPAVMAVTPVVTTSLQSMPITMSALSTPVLTPSQASAAAVAALVTNPATTGARPKTPTIPSPPPIPPPDHVTRSTTGKSQPRQFPHDFVTVGKSLVTSMKSKNQKKD